MYFQLVEPPTCVPARHSINHGAKVALFREGHILGIFIEPHKSVGPIVIRVEKKGESLHASSREERHACYGCAHTMATLNVISPLMVFSGTIRRIARLPQNFSVSSHAPAWERAESSGWVTSAMWNCVREGQILWHSQSTWLDSSHQPGSLANYM